MSDRKKVKKKREQMQVRIMFMSFVFMTVLILVGVVRVAWIKAVNGAEYENNSIANQMNRIRDQVITPNRGAILDRNKQALAISSTVYNIILDPRVLSQQETKVQNETINGLLQILSDEPEVKEKEDEIRNSTKINPQTGKPNIDSNWYYVAKSVSFEKGREIKNKGFRCVYVEENTKRTYPHDAFAAQIIGFGTSLGLENWYNDSLVGVPGRVFRTYESDNSIVTREIAPQEGNTIVTTIDQNIQQFAENACKEAYDSCKPNHVPLSTSAIVMDPNTGEILAMAEYPTFNLNDPTSISLETDSYYKQKWDSLSDDEKKNLIDSTWKNFNITDTFEPGSIYKPIVVAAAYEEGAITANDTFYCGGKKVFNDEEINCHLRSGHGTQNAEQVLANSCNVGMMDIISRLGREKYYKYQRDFGFGEETGIDLPNETSAIKLLYSLEDLAIVQQLATSSFGQGFNCTSIQAINAFAAAINGGNLMRPHLVSQILDQNGNVIREIEPHVVRKVVSDDTSDYLRKSLESVITSTGTGKKAQIDGYAIGGKTGTAQQGRRDDEIYTLDFITYFPVEEPQYICMLVMHHPENYTDGVVSPVPIMKNLMMNIIDYKNIPPSYESEQKNQNDENEASVVINDYTNKSLKDTISELNGLGVNFDLVGSTGNVVTKQRPDAGSKVAVGSTVLLFVGTQGEPELVQIPNVKGLSVDEATEVLTASGFEYSIREEPVQEGETQAELSENTTNDVSNNDENDDQESKENVKRVYYQIPASGSSVERGTIVKIKID